MIVSNELNATSFLKKTDIQTHPSQEEAMIVRIPFSSINNDIDHTTEGSLPSIEPIINTGINNDNTTVDDEIMAPPALREVKFSGPFLKADPKIRCWWCCHVFQGIPVHLPHHLDVNGVFHVLGYFCSFNCTVAYNYAQRDFDVDRRSTLLHLMYEKALGKQSHTRLVPAPPRELLKDFGGDMTINDFRRDSCTLKKEHRLLLPPLQPVVARIEKANPIGVTQTTPVVPLTEKNVSKAKESLLLKRSKPRKTNHISLESTMGIKRKSDTKTSSNMS